MWAKSAVDVVSGRGVIQDEGVRAQLVTLATLAPVLFTSALLTACTASGGRVRPEPRVTSPDPAPRIEEAVTLEEPAPPVEVAPPRPRLSQTITLGQGTPDQFTPSRGPIAPGATPAMQPVVINNSVVVNGGVPVYGYGVGYGARGYGYGRATTFAEGGRSGRANVGRAWAPNGWEGAGRTAAPGQTPGVGGNWAPVPSYGPATMK